MTNERSAPTRRTLLGAVATGVAAGTAGCFGTLPPLGGRVNFGRVDTPPSSAPTYRDWIPDPDALSADGRGLGDIYQIEYAEPFALREPPLGTHLHRPRTWWPRLDYLGVDTDTLDAALRIGSSYVLLGPFEAGVVRDGLVAGGYDEGDGHGEYATYVRPEVGRAAAVSDGAAVWSAAPAPRSDVEAILGAKAGTVDRYHEVDDTFETVLNLGGGGPYVRLGADTWSLARNVDALTESYSVRIDDDGVYLVYHLLYEDAAAVAEGRLRRELRWSRQARTALSVDLEIDGRVATAELHQSAASFASERTAVDEWPTATWHVDVDRDAGSATVSHVAGDPVDAEWLRLSLPEVGVPLHEETTDTQFADAYDTVGPGDGVTVDVSNPSDDDPRLLLVYGHRSAGRWVPMLSYDLAEDR